MLITTACLFAVMYIGVKVLSTIFGVVTVAIGIKVLYFNENFVFAGITISKYPALILIILGAFFLYVGTRDFFGRQANK